MVPRHRRASLEAIDDLLATLPDQYVVAPVGDLRLVAGPPGVYLVAPGEPVDGDPVDPALLSLRLRALLAEHLTLVPYVHPIVVGDARAHPGSATVLPPDLLVDLLVEGAPILSDHLLDRIGQLDAAGTLRTRSEPPTTVRGWAGAPAFH